jgi:SMI1 / KNR4 family (SUKH-1)
MEECIRRFEQWLAAHAPTVFETLKSPAPDKGGPWSRFERELGFTLPEDFRALYAAHNGQRPGRPGVFDGLRWLGLDEALDRYCDEEGEHGADAWPASWVPFAGDDQFTLVVDYGEAPAPVLRVDRDGVAEQLAATLRGYLSNLVSEAEAGRRRLVPGRGLVLDPTPFT